MAAPKNVLIKVPQIKIERHVICLVGQTPLIVHAFPEKARKAMLDKQMKEPDAGREARDPFAEVEAATYHLPDGRYGFPAVAFKSSAVEACTSLASVTKVAARQAFRVAGEPMNRQGIIEGSFVRTALVPLVCQQPIIREDVVRLSGPSRQAEVRYRPEFQVWGVALDVELNRTVISISQLVGMFRAAGIGVGVGDYRSERDGDCGYFEVVTEDQFEKWRKVHVDAVEGRVSRTKGRKRAASRGRAGRVA